MIPLMKNVFSHEAETRAALAQFILYGERLSMGEQCAKFERAFAQMQGSDDAVLFNSGGSANLAILQALKNLGRLKDGDRIGFSALTWSTNVMPIIQLGMVPVAIDCDPTTLNISVNTSWPKIDALFITNALGFTADLAAIKFACDNLEIPLIEDNCEALGTELITGKAGNFGVASSFSFFTAHHMSTIEGGMVCTRDHELAQMLRIVRANGWDRNLSGEQQTELRTLHGVSGFDAQYTFYDLGFNLRPTEITGFLGLYQLRFLSENILKREANYLRLEKKVALNPDLMLLDHSHIIRLSSFAFPVVCWTPKIRDKYLSRFVNAGVEVRPMIAGNMQRQPFYNKYVDTDYDLPGADLIHTCGFYCGNYPELTEEDLQVIESCL